MKARAIKLGSLYEVKSGKETRKVLALSKDLPIPVWDGKAECEPKPGATPVVQFEIVKGKKSGTIGSLYLFQFANWAHKEVAA